MSAVAGGGDKVPRHLSGPLASASAEGLQTTSCGPEAGVGPGRWFGGMVSCAGPEAAGVGALGSTCPTAITPRLRCAAYASPAPRCPAGPLMGHATRLATPPGALACLAFSPPSFWFPGLTFVHLTCSS